MAFYIKSWFLAVAAIILLIGGGIFLSKNRDLLDLVYSPKTIYVKIEGNINNPGIYKMKNGDRVEDIIEKAGGHLDQEKVQEYNPHTLLEDGGSIWLGDR